MTTAPLSRRILFSWRHFSGVLRDVLLPNGKPVTTFTLEHPGAVVIIPITDSGSILFPDFDSKNLQLPDIIAQVCPTS
jgi:hypothetical protein